MKLLVISFLLSGFYSQAIAGHFFCTQVFNGTTKNNLHYLSQRLEVRPVIEGGDVDSVVDLYANEAVIKQVGLEISREVIESAAKMSQKNLDQARQALESKDEKLFILSGVFLKEKLIGAIIIREYTEDKLDLMNKVVPGVLANGRKWVTQGVAFLPEYHRQGFGQEVSELRLKMIFEDLNADGIFVDISATNQGSLGLSKKMGFKPLGINVPWLEGEFPMFTLSREDYFLRMSSSDI